MLLLNHMFELKDANRRSHRPQEKMDVKADWHQHVAIWACLKEYIQKQPKLPKGKSSQGVKLLEINICAAGVCWRINGHRVAQKISGMQGS
jgi:hypothetical protein